MIPEIHRTRCIYTDVVADLNDRMLRLIEQATAQYRDDARRRQRRLRMALAGPPCYGPYPGSRRQ